MQIEFDQVALRHGGRSFGYGFNGSADIEWDAAAQEWIIWSITVLSNENGSDDLELKHCAKDGSFKSDFFWGLAEGILEDCEDQFCEATANRSDDARADHGDLIAAE